MVKWNVVVILSYFPFKKVVPIHNRTLPIHNCTLPIQNRTLPIHNRTDSQP